MDSKYENCSYNGLDVVSGHAPTTLYVIAGETYIELTRHYRGGSSVGKYRIQKSLIQMRKQDMIDEDIGQVSVKV